MSAPLVRHGWTIAFEPQLFARQVVELKAEVKRLKQELDPQSFVQHRLRRARLRTRLSTDELLALSRGEEQP